MEVEKVRASVLNYRLFSRNFISDGARLDEGLAVRLGDIPFDWNGVADCENNFVVRQVGGE